MLTYAGIDYATLLVPQQHVGQADRERRARVPKEERQYWSDKNDFCRYLLTYADVCGRMLTYADRERRARVPKEERQYWSDKNDFCRYPMLTYADVC
jgi:ribosomal protein L20